jgi:hypothetical protein
MTPQLDYVSPAPQPIARLEHPAGEILVTAPAGVAATLEQDEATIICTISNQLDSTWTGIVGIFLDVPLSGDQPFFLLPSYLYGTNRAEQPVHPKAKRWPRLRQAEPDPVIDFPFSSYFTVRGDRLTCPVAMVRAGGAAVGLSGAVYHDAHGARFADGPPGDATRATGAGFAHAPSGGATPATGAGADSKDVETVAVAGFGCAWLADRARLIYTIGHENAPWLYDSGQLELGESRDETDEAGSARTAARSGGRLSLGPGVQIRFEVEVHHVAAGGSDDNRCLAQIIRSVSRSAHQEPRRIPVELGAPTPTSTSDEIPKAVNLLAGALFDHAYYKPAHNYCTTLTERDGAVIQDTDSFSISWTGGLSVAVPLLISAHRMRRDTAAASRVRDWDTVRAQALECIQHFCRSSRNPASGLPFDAFRDGRWTTNGWWEEYIWSLEGKRGHSSYLIGEALYYLLLAFDVEKSHGTPEIPHRAES